MAGQDMVRVSIQITPEAYEQIAMWADKAHMKRTYFMSVALTQGARALAKTIHPEMFMTQDIWNGVASAMGVDAAQLQAGIIEREQKNGKE